jgi:hypothetical protein
LQGALAITSQVNHPRSKPNIFREWLKPVRGQPAEAGWQAPGLSGFHQLKLVANRESAEAD